MGEPDVRCSWPTDRPISCIVRRVDKGHADNGDVHAEAAQAAEALLDNGTSTPSSSSSTLSPDCTAAKRVSAMPSLVIATAPLNGECDAAAGTDGAAVGATPQPPLELELRFKQGMVRVTRLEVATDARVVEWLADGEYAGTSRVTTSCGDDLLPRATCPNQMRPGRVITARLRLLPDDGQRCTLGDVAYSVEHHSSTPVQHSFDMALVRERLNRLGDGRELSPEASELMARIDLDHSRSASLSGGGDGADGGAGSMLGAVAAAAASMGIDSSSGSSSGLGPRVGALPPALANMAQMLAGFGGGSRGPAMSTSPSVTPTAPVIASGMGPGPRTGPLPPAIASMAQMLAGFGGGSSRGSSATSASEEQCTNDGGASRVTNGDTVATSEPSGGACSGGGHGSSALVEDLIARLEERLTTRMNRLESKLDRILELIDGVDAT